MSAKSVEVIGLSELVQDFHKAGGDATQLVRAALKNSVSKGQREIRERAPHVFGTLQRSVLTEIDYPTASIEVQAEYGRDVEEGRGPHNVSVSAIERWAKKKGIPSNRVYPIVNSIRRKGTKAHPYFEPGWKASQDYIKKQFDKVADRILAVMTGR